VNYNRSAKVVPVIEIHSAAGEGNEKSPVREIIEYWTLEGKKIAIIDEWAECNVVSTENNY